MSVESARGAERTILSAGGILDLDLCAGLPGGCASGVGASGARPSEDGVHHRAHGVHRDYMNGLFSIAWISVFTGMTEWKVQHRFYCDEWCLDYAPVSMFFSQI